MYTTAWPLREIIYSVFGFMSTASDVKFAMGTDHNLNYKLNVICKSGTIIMATVRNFVVMSHNFILERIYT
jgi:hypothetical protein